MNPLAHRLPQLRLARCTALLAVLFALAAFTAWSLTSPDRASAQQVATPVQVHQSAAPELSWKYVKGGVQISWTFDADSITPAGWELTEFALRYWIENRRTSLAYLDPSPSATARSRNHTPSGNNFYYWTHGEDAFYGIQAVYERKSDGLERRGKDKSIRVLGPATVDQVKNAAGPGFSSEAQEDGVKLTWTYDASTRTPRGWNVSHFEIYRWFPKKPEDVVVAYKSSDPAARSTVDTSVKDFTLAQRLPGFKWKYGIRAYFDRLGVNTNQWSKITTLTFTTPTLPNVKNLVVNHVQGYEDRVSWDPPDLSWHSGFSGVSEYRIYAPGTDRTERFTTSTSRVFGRTNCAGIFVSYRSGIFYSKQLRATENSGCGND